MKKLFLPVRRHMFLILKILINEKSISGITGSSYNHYNSDITILQNGTGKWKLKKPGWSQAITNNLTTK